MSIVYGFYTQGSSATVVYGTSASNYSIISTNGINHVVVTPTVNCFINLSEATSNAALAATTANGTFVGSYTPLVIPTIRKAYLSVIGSTTNGILYLTEMLNA